jgi:hypothetical protein
VLGAFQLDVVLLGQDEDGDDITSCVLVPTDAPTRAGKPVKPTNRETFLLRALNEELDSLGSQAPIAGNAELALGAKVWQRMAEEDSVRERFRQLLGSSSNERRDWSAARNGCVGKHLVGSGSGFLWIAEKPY